jgi:5,10-methenyltetrahydromethanopterin hydrogenase
MWDSIDLISSNLKLQIFIRDGLSDEEIAKRLAEQISVTIGNRHAILDYLLNYLCEEINRVG